MQAVAHLDLLQKLMLDGVDLLQRNDLYDSLEVFNRCLAIRPAYTPALALKSVVLSELQQIEAARCLVDFERFVRRYRPGPPVEFKSLTEFNNRLVDSVVGHESLSERKFTLMPSGRTTENLLPNSNEVVCGLENMIRRAVRVYMRIQRALPPHAFLPSRIPSTMWLTIWGNVLESNEQLGSHYHPNSWLSGVYYAQVPEEIPVKEERSSGAIEFGRPNTDLNCTSAPEVMTIVPEEGMMLLFPSYIFHGTIPFQAPKQRISLAFELAFPDR